MIAFVYEPAALRYSPERKYSFPSSFMADSSSERGGISMVSMRHPCWSSTMVVCLGVHSAPAS